MVSVGPLLPFPLTGPHLDLLLSGVTPLSRVLHQFGGGVMLPNWCMPLRLVLWRAWGWFPDNVARNSPAAASNLEFASLELQRFERHLKTDRGKLCATFIRRDPVVPSGPPAPFTLVMRGVCSLARPFVPCHTLCAYLVRFFARV